MVTAAMTQSRTRPSSQTEEKMKMQAVLTVILVPIVIAFLVFYTLNGCDEIRI